VSVGRYDGDHSSHATSPAEPFMRIRLTPI
jgi:hypothetical protein